VEAATDVRENMLKQNAVRRKNAKLNATNFLHFKNAKLRCSEK